jgi:hypothetical protein
MAIATFCGALAVINGPVAVYRASVDHVTPYGWHSRLFWLATAAMNVAIGVLGAWLVFRADLRERRLSAGRCVWCGYDLRATPNACPECGRTPQRKRGNK